MEKLSSNIIANSLNFHARDNANSIAMVYGDRRTTWKELGNRANRMANALIGAGVRKNDKVAFMFHNCPAFLETNYAIQCAGAIPVPVNYRFTGPEITYQVNHSDARVFIYEATFAEAVEAAAPQLAKIERFVCDGPSTITGCAAYEDFLNSGKTDIPQVATDWSDVAVMVYTGGTTGFPKGVMLTYAGHVDMFCNLFASIVTRTAEVDLTAEQLKGITKIVAVPGMGLAPGLLRTRLARKILSSKKAYTSIEKAVRYLLTHPPATRIGYKSTVRFMTPSMPFFHDASYQILMLGVLLGNTCQIMVDGLSFDPEKILSAVEAERPLFMANVPTGWKKLVSFPDFHKYNVKSLLAIATGAGVCPVDLKKKMFEKFPGVLLLDMFGQTEMTPITSFRVDTGPENLKERSVGKSILDVRVVDEKGNDVPQGEVGEIMYRSGWIMKGYYKDNEKTAEAMQDGWFKGGDLGYIDEDGEVRLVDRKKECINTGGEKVFPMEVEEVLHHHPAVDDVCIIGVPDEEWGHTVRAVIKPVAGTTPDPADILAFCKGKLAGFKIPRSVVLVDELPLSPVGKMLRAKIRELYGKP